MPRDHRLSVSVAANALLAAGLIWSWARPGRVPLLPSTAVATPAPVAASNVKRAPAPQRSADGAEWPQWLAQLRTAGVSHRVLAGLVTADFDRRWEQTQRQLQHAYDTGEIDAETLQRAQTQHDRALEDELRQALGADGFRAWKKEALLRPFILAGVPLSDVESDRIYDLRRTDEEQRRRLGEAQQRGEIDRLELGSRLAALDADYQTKLMDVLGEKRINAMNAAGDGVDVDVRRQLKQANLPTGQVEGLADVQRARDILQNDLAAQAGHNAEGSPGFEARRLAIDAARDQAFERILGPAGWAELQKSRDPRFQNLQHYAAAWQLNETEVASVYSAIEAQDKQARDDRLQALAAERQGQPADWAAVQNRIDERARQAEKSLRHTLGGDRYERLQRNNVLATRP